MTSFGLIIKCILHFNHSSYVLKTSILAALSFHMTQLRMLRTNSMVLKLSFLLIMMMKKQMAK